MKTDFQKRTSDAPTCTTHTITKIWVVDKHKAKGGRWRCPQCSTNYLHKYRKQNSGYLAQQDRIRRAAYRLAHKIEISEYAKAYMPEYREKNKAKLKAKRQSPDDLARRRTNRARRNSRKTHSHCTHCEGHGYANFATGKCYICLSHNADTTDHVIPLSLGGKHCILNLRGACMACNQSKGNRVYPGHKDWISFLTEKRKGQIEQHLNTDNRRSVQHL